MREFQFQVDVRTKRALKCDLNADPLLWLANVPEKHIQVHVFAPRTGEAKTPCCRHCCGVAAHTNLSFSRNICLCQNILVTWPEHGSVALTLTITLVPWKKRLNSTSTLPIACWSAYSTSCTEKSFWFGRKRFWANNGWWVWFVFPATRVRLLGRSRQLELIPEGPLLRLITTIPVTRQIHVAQNHARHLWHQLMIKIFLSKFDQGIEGILLWKSKSHKKKMLRALG